MGTDKTVSSKAPEGMLTLSELGAELDMSYENIRYYTLILFGKDGVMKFPGKGSTMTMHLSPGQADEVRAYVAAKRSGSEVKPKLKTSGQAQAEARPKLEASSTDKSQPVTEAKRKLEASSTDKSQPAAEAKPKLATILVKRGPGLRVKYEGSDALKHFVAQGIPIKECQSKSSDMDRSSYSTETPIEMKKYKVGLFDKLLVINITRRPKAGVNGAQGTKGVDGLQNFYKWMRDAVGALIPEELRDIENGTFPAYTKTPKGSLHLYFKYKGPRVAGQLCQFVEVTTTQVSLGYNNYEPYIFYGDLGKAPELPGFIAVRLPKPKQAQAAQKPLFQTQTKAQTAPVKPPIVQPQPPWSRGTLPVPYQSKTLAAGTSSHKAYDQETEEVLLSPAASIALRINDAGYIVWKVEVNADDTKSAVTMLHSLLPQVRGLISEQGLREHQPRAPRVSIQDKGVPA